MTRNYGVYRIAGAIAACVIVLSLSTSTGRDRNSYQMETQVYGVPGYQSDATRAIDAYERLMERHMDLTERNLAQLAADVGGLAAKLDAVDARLTQMDRRLARIEKHLGVPPLPPPVQARPDPNALPMPNVPAGTIPPVPR